MEILKSKKTVVLATVAAVALASPAAAQDLSPITNLFTTIGTALTGTLGRAAGLVALAGVGFAFLAGRMNWAVAGSILIGLVIIFGAATILAGL